MSNSLNTDLRARAELLAYLVVSQLLARQMSGKWLSVEHLADSTMLWLKANGVSVEGMQRVLLGAQALDVAEGLEDSRQFDVTPESVRTLFCENLHLDFRSPVAREIYQRCLIHLVDSGDL
jgi:hypothetical protein